MFMTELASILVNKLLTWSGERWLMMIHLLLLDRLAVYWFTM